MVQFQLDKPDNLVELFESSVKRFPDRPFLGTKNKQGVYEWVTYREVGRRVDNLRADWQAWASRGAMQWASFPTTAPTGLSAIMPPWVLGPSTSPCTKRS